MKTLFASSRRPLWLRGSINAKASGKRRGLTLSGVLLGSLLALQAAPLRVGGLQCEWDPAPMNLDEQHPRLSWQVASEEAGARQTAWQVLAASSPDLLQEGKADLWDSGRVAGSDTVGTRYAGKQLEAFQTVWWTVRTWNANSEVSDWSEPRTWETGPLSAADWKSAWIAAPGSQDNTLLRKEFTIGKGLRKARLYVCGLGSYEGSLNGVKVGRDLLAPGWTDFDKTTLFASHDVTGHLQEGANALGLSLGNGMYHVIRRNRFAKFTKSFGPQRAIALLRLEYNDGRIETVGTDGTWQSAAGPLTSNGIYSGEDLDARLSPEAWDKPGFDARGWLPAVPILRLSHTLKGHAHDSQPVREMAVHKPVRITQLPGGIVSYDLGQNASHMPRVTVSGPAGSTIRIIPAEEVAEDGTLVRTTMGGLHRGINWWQYTKRSDEPETWTPGYFYVGCRHLQVEHYAPGEALRDSIEALKLQMPDPSEPAGRPRIEALEGVVLHADVAETGDFKSSDPLLNQIRELIRWAQKSNMVSVLTDCPHREKLGWIEQFHLNGPAIRYEFDVNRIYTKAMADMRDAQYPEGMVPNIAPEYADFKGTFKAAAEWGAAFILVPWQQYLFTGDTSLMEKHFSAMLRYRDWVDSQAVEGITKEGLGDWYDVGPKKPGKAQLTPPEITASAFLLHDTEMLARMAKILGKQKEAELLEKRTTELREANRNRFFNVESGDYGTGSQCANALALAMELCPPEARATVLEKLIHKVEENGYAATAGDVGFRYLLRALADAGRNDVVLGILTQREKPGYAFQLAKGATSLTESWDANLGSSHNHFMLGQATEWLYHDLLGIAPDPEQPGFEHVLLKPAPVGDLQWVEGHYDSVRGRIAVRWARKDGSFLYQVKLPANTTATLRLPCKAGTQPRYSEAAGEAGHVRQSARGDDWMELKLVSGEWKFETELP